jgi:hypothetical protein
MVRVKPAHHAARAKSVIFLYMTGGVSHIESFDYKPKLFADHGKKITTEHWGQTPGKYERYIIKPHWNFSPGGKSGIHVSDLFPHARAIVDDLCVINSMHSSHTNHYRWCMIRSMVTEAINHDPAITFFQTGSQLAGRPSIGSWVSYGLGTENQNLPSFVAIAPHAPYAGTQTWGSDFLPGCHQGTHIVPGPVPVANMNRRTVSPALQSLELERLASMNRRHSDERALDAMLEARIRSFETAFGMQAEAPEVFDLADESPSTA